MVDWVYVAYGAQVQVQNYTALPPVSVNMALVTMQLTAQPLSILGGVITVKRCRRVDVAAEDRTISVAADDRIVTVPAENRTIEVECD